MSLFHNSPEAEKLASAWHIFALWASLAELVGAVFCFMLAIFGRTAIAYPQQVAHYALGLLMLAALCGMVAAFGQVAFHVKGIVDHNEHRKQLEQKKRMGITRGGGVCGD